ncbi:MAG: hypothetical protein ABIA74_05285 [bacterium]
MEEEKPKKCKKVGCNSKEFVKAGKNGGNPKRQSYKCKKCKKIFVKGDNRKGRKIKNRVFFDKEIIKKVQTLLIKKNKVGSIIEKINNSKNKKQKNKLKKKWDKLRKNSNPYYTLEDIKKELEKKYPNKKIPKISTLSVWGKKYKPLG